MITRIALSNVQSLAAAELEIGPWTSIVGESDRGKSAIVRAVYALCTNPRGDTLIRQGANECAVSIHLDSQRVVTWTKRRGRLGTYELDGEPATIEAVHAVLPVALAMDGEELLPGFQRQHDAPFLFADTARQRAKVLGEFDGTNLLLAADGAVRRQQREAQERARVRREDARRHQGELEAFAWVDTARDAALAAEGSLARAHARAARVDALTALVAALEDVGGQMAVIDRHLAVIGDLEPARLALTRAEGLLARLGSIEATGRQAATIVREVAAVGRFTMPDLDPWRARLDHLSAGSILLTEAAVLQVNAQSLVAEDGNLLVEETVVRQELAKLVGELCPTCGNALTAEAIEAGVH